MLPLMLPCSADVGSTRTPLKLREIFSSAPRLLRSPPAQSSPAFAHLREASGAHPYAGTQALPPRLSAPQREAAVVAAVPVPFHSR